MPARLQAAPQRANRCIAGRSRRSSQAGAGDPRLVVDRVDRGGLIGDEHGAAAARRRRQLDQLQHARVAVARVLHHPARRGCHVCGVPAGRLALSRELHCASLARGLHKLLGFALWRSQMRRSARIDSSPRLQAQTLHNASPPPRCGRAHIAAGDGPLHRGIAKPCEAHLLHVLVMALACNWCSTCIAGRSSPLGARARAVVWTRRLAAPQRARDAVHPAALPGHGGAG